MCIDICIVLICILLLFIGLYAVYDNYMTIQDSLDSSILKFKPGYEQDEENTQQPKDMVAWLTIDNTTIDYPVMQGIDNLEYLNKNPFGEYSLAGSIFLDFRNKADFSDEYNLIYGHHMDGGNMFGALDAYENETYLEEHNTGILTVGNKVYDINLFATITVDATDKIIFSISDKEKVLSYIKKQNKNSKNFDISKNEKLIALSTCKYPDTIDRTVVIGTLSNKEEYYD